MTWVAAAVAGGAIIGGVITSQGAQSAAGTQANAANAATQAQLGMFNTINQQNAPFRQSGEVALSDINTGLGHGGNEYSNHSPEELRAMISSLEQQRDGPGKGDPVFNQEIAKINQALTTQANPSSLSGGQFTHQFNASDLNTNLAPNYEFMKSQGQGATANLNAATGGLLSGNTLKAISDYTTNYAGNAYQQAFENFNANQSNIFNRLADVAGFGQTANQTTAGAGANIAQSAANTMVGAGTARAAGTVGAANAYAGSLNNAASWYALRSFMQPPAPNPNAGPGPG